MLPQQKLKTNGYFMDIIKHGNKVTVIIDGEIFTEYFQGPVKPCLYPVISPYGENMTRHFPFIKDLPGENYDHPWQSGIYFTFGKINNLDFWNITEKDKQKIRMTELHVESGKIKSSNDWLSEEKIILSDRTEIGFEVDENMRAIDYKVTLKADHGDLLFGDDKEGMMGIRMDQSFRVSDRGAVLFNSEGNKGEDAWGKRALWVTYINKNNAVITVMDHPDNLRHPTRWHARDYGLCAANPFGEKVFDKESTEEGSYLLTNGKSITFSYRFVFHRNTDPDKINLLYNIWTQR